MRFCELGVCVWILFVLLRVRAVERPLVIGHRGSAYLPELTLASQSIAHALRADIIELDVCLSRDDQLIVVHDLYLNAVSDVATLFPGRNRSDGYHYVLDFDLAELRRLTVHERIVPFTQTQVYPARFPWSSSTPFPLATLNETIELLLGLTRSTGRRYELLIEIKNPEYHTRYNRSISSVLLATLSAYNLSEATDPVLIQTFHIEELIRIRRQFGSRLRLVALLTWNWMNESSSDYDFYRSAEGLQNLSSVVQAIAPNMDLLAQIGADGTILETTELTAMAHKYQLAVFPWTFRQDTFKGNFAQLIEFFHRTVQVDGFITSQPDVVIELLERSASLAPRESSPSTVAYCLAFAALLSTSFVS